MGAFSSSSFSTSAFSVNAFFFDAGGPIGAWLSGVSHFRNTSGVSRIAHTEAGDPVSAVSMDKTDGVTERWWIE